MSDQEQSVGDLKPRTVFPKPAKTQISAYTQPGVFILKFWEGTHVVYQDGIFTFDPARTTAQDLKLLNRAELELDSIAKQLQALNALLQSAASIVVERMFQRPDLVLEKEQLEAQQNIGEELADKTLYYYLAYQNASQEQTVQVIDQINAFSVVEIAYPHIIPQPASPDISPVTPDFSASQGYLNPAPVGIDARYAWGFVGGRGHAIRVFDVETAWVRDHEDLPRLSYDGSGVDLGDSNHGTAVIGILAAQDNGFGITGIVSQASLGVVTTLRLAITPIPAAIDDAVSHMQAGEVLVIEHHFAGPSSNLPCNDGNCEQWEFVAVEYAQADFDAIRHATARNIIVVEPAGNGGMDLDAPR